MLTPNRNCLFSFHHKYQHRIPYLLSPRNEDRMVRITCRLLLDQLNETSCTPSRSSLRKAMGMVIRRMAMPNTMAWATRFRRRLNTATAFATAPMAHILALEALPGRTLE